MSYCSRFYNRLHQSSFCHQKHKSAAVTNSKQIQEDTLHSKNIRLTKEVEAFGAAFGAAWYVLN